MLSDTVVGYALHNLISDPNVVGRAQSMDVSYPFAQHEITFGDSVQFDGIYTYFDSVGTLELPAGSFERCVYARDDSNSGGVYAPNVGLVQVIYEGQIVMELASYSGNCGPESIDVDETLTNGTQLVASGDISISSNIEAEANVTVQAGNYILLNPGFEVPKGSIVTFLIEACGGSAAYSVGKHK